VQASDAMVRLVKSMEEGPSLDFTIIAWSTICLALSFPQTDNDSPCCATWGWGKNGWAKLQCCIIPGTTGFLPILDCPAQSPGKLISMNCSSFALTFLWVQSVRGIRNRQYLMPLFPPSLAAVLAMPCFCPATAPVGWPITHSSSFYGLRYTLPSFCPCRPKDGISRSCC
jgi:hypothetical protein